MAEMNEELAGRIVPRILSEFAFKKSDDGRWLNQGKCPACGKKSLFTSAQSPWVLRCGRENKCGMEYSVRDLYPEEFGQYNKRFPSTPQNPNATADAYMREARGLNTMRMKSYYTQEKWWSGQAQSGTATVRFYLPNSTSYMERFVDPVEIVNADGSREVRKQNFSGPHAGLWWQPPEMIIQDGDEVWITEGIIDAISLWQNGIKAVAILSCSNYPKTALANCTAQGVRWVWALDNDKAGKAAIRKFVARMRNADIECGAAIAPQKSKCDWNDLHRLEKLTEDDLAEYRYHGALLIAQSVEEKAALLFVHNKAHGFVVDFGNQLYWWSVEQKALEALIESGDFDYGRTNDETTLNAVMMVGKTQRIANARPEFLYFQRAEVTDESWFYARIHFPDSRPAMNMTFTPGQITASAEFKKRLASAQGAWWSGEAKHLDWIGTRWLQGLKTVETIEYIGYSREHDCYIFPRIAVQGGKTYDINEEDFFDLPKKSIKSLSRERQMHIETTPRHYRQDWPQLVWRAFGTDGMIAAVYWFASLFAEQVRKCQSSFPFLEVIGEPGSGKTTLIEFLWRLLGQDREGIDPNKGTRAGLDRSLAQHSNMPNVFIEADRSEDSHARKFDWDELKPFYNGRGMRVRGLKNSGNETYEPPFRGTLVIAQNDQVNASDAVLERIVQLRFTKAGHSADSKAATDEMVRLGIEELSYFVLLATIREKEVVSYVTEKMPKYQEMLLNIDGIHHARLAKNHAQLIAFAEQFAAIFGLSDEQKKATCAALKDACIERQTAIAADHPVVADFWETFDYLDGQGRKDDSGRTVPALNHSRDPNLIAVNLNEFIEMAGNARQQVPLLRDLKRHLRSSKHRKFVDASRTVSSAIACNSYGQPKTPRCWIFQRARGEQTS